MRSFGHLCLQNYYFGTSLELIPLYDQSVKSWEFQIREIRYCWEGNTMLLREKDDVLINVTWDCFDQSNFYICRINIIEWNNIHLLHAGEGNIIQLITVFWWGKCVDLLTFENKWYSLSPKGNTWHLPRWILNLRQCICLFI
jgi:hypothetical protein